jgi:hypothetical protein
MISKEHQDIAQLQEEQRCQVLYSLWEEWVHKAVATPKDENARAYFMGRTGALYPSPAVMMFESFVGGLRMGKELQEEFLAPQDYQARQLTKTFNKLLNVSDRSLLGLAEAFITGLLEASENTEH